MDGIGGVVGLLLLVDVRILWALAHHQNSGVTKDSQLDREWIDRD